MRRRIAVLIGVLLTVGGAGSALGINAGVRRAARLPEGAIVPEVGPVTAPTESGPEAIAESVAPRRTKAEYIDGILGRNIFDPDAIGKSTPGSEGGDLLSTLDVKLIGTIVAIPEQYSSALLLETTGNASPRGYGIGDHVQDAEIIKIEPDKVHVKRSNGQIEIITMGGTETPRATSEPAAEGSAEEGIEQVSDTKFIIERSVYERYLGDLDAISRMGRAIPHRGADGEIDGYRLSGIRRDSLGSQIGIKNGDIVHAVNGKPLISMKDALDALGTLQSESAFQFEITRRGQKVTLEYEVR